MEFQSFLGGSYQSQAATADQEELFNWYLERIESKGATARAALYPTPGVTLLASASVGVGRAHWGSPTLEVEVIGAGVYTSDRYGVSSLVGTVAVDANPATISSNGDVTGELFITSGGNGYIYDILAGTLTQVVALNGKATQGDFLDGYFIALDGNTSTFYISDLFDGLTWDPTQFAQRSIAADPWQGMKVANRYIYLVGTKTGEIWYDSGASPFPFQPHQSGLMGYGIAAPFSIAEADGALIWLAATKSGTGYVCRAQGFVPEIISTFGFQHSVSSYTVFADAVAESYQDQGHTFYLLSFPTADATWSWDAQTQIWARRGTWYSDESRWGAWRPRWHASAYGEHRILDSKGTGIYKLSIEVGTDVESRPIRRLRRAPALTFELKRLFYKSFELDLEPGLGLVSGQGETPMVMMRMSNDGGKTWGSERWRSAGKIGEYGKRVRFERCGSARRRVFEVSVTDPIPWRLTAAYLELTDPPGELARQRAA